MESNSSGGANQRRKAWTRSIGTLALLLASSGSGSALALSGTHGPAISTWDTRASSVVTAYDAQGLPGGLLQVFTYNTNFSSTTGRLSSQFGVHYLNYVERDFGTLHGISVGAVTAYGMPILPRYQNGLARLEWRAYAGLVPVSLVGVTHNYLSLPLVAGAGITYAPIHFLTVTPWIEAAPNFSFDTVINPASFNLNEIAGTVGEDGQVDFTVEDVQGLLSDAIQIEAVFAAALRGGLSVAAHLGKRFDLTVHASVGTGALGSGALAFGGGAGLTFHWDRVVPAVLPNKEVPNADAPGVETPGAESTGAESTGAETPGVETPSAKPASEGPGTRPKNPFEAGG